MNKFTFVFLLAALLFCFAAGVNGMEASNEKGINLEKRGLMNESAAEGDGYDSCDDGCTTTEECTTTERCTTTATERCTTTQTAFFTSSTQTTTVTHTSEKTVFSELPTFTTTTSTTVAYRPTNDIVNGSGHASAVSKLTFIVLAFVAMLFI